MLLSCYGVAGAQTKSKSLDGALTHPTEVTELNLNGSQARKTLPPEIAKLTNLKVLKLYGCGLDSLPKEIGQLKNLEVLDLGGNYLKKLPAEFCNLTNLKELNLKRNEIELLPDEIGNLKNLTSLDLSYNKLSSLPLSFYMLKKLIILNLDWNQLTYLSGQFIEMSSLEILNIGNNKLEYIPDKIWFAPKLYSLNLYKCGAMLTVPNNICDVPAFSTKARGANIDNWHVPGSFLFPKCPYGEGGIRNGWYIAVSN